MRFHTKPWKHQIEALNYLYPRSFGALYTGMGSGKTKTMIDLIVNRGWKTTIIVAPKKVCRVWAPEFQVHAPNERIHVLDVSDTPGKAKVGAVVSGVSAAKNGQLVIVCNYDSIWREPFKKFLLNKLKIDAVICDESHRIKSPSSRASRMLQLLGRRVPNRFMMTGTPLSQSPLDVYAQYRFLDESIFGTNYARFKEEYANYITASGGFPMLDKKNPYKNLDKLHEKMFSCAYKNENIDQNLPKTLDVQFDFRISPKAEKHYKELLKEGVAELQEGYVLAGNVLAIMTRLRQVLSGYLPVENDEGEKKIVEIDDARKEALRELLESLPPDEPVVVFANYRKDIKNIRRIVHELGRKSSELSGMRDTLHNWQAGKTQVLVVHIRAGAEGISLVRARYCIYYTLTHSVVQYEQSRKRVHRPGQKRPVVYYTLVAKLKKGKSLDEKIIESLANNQSLADSIMEDRVI